MEAQIEEVAPRLFVVARVRNERACMLQGLVVVQAQLLGSKACVPEDDGEGVALVTW